MGKTVEDRDQIVQQNNNCDEDPIVITPGTDTMAETAAILAQRVKNKTVELTGAMIPIKFGGSDGLFNCRKKGSRHINWFFVGLIYFLFTLPGQKNHGHIQGDADYFVSLNIAGMKAGSTLILGGIDEIYFVLVLVFTNLEVFKKDT